MISRIGKMPSSQVMKAIRRLGGISSHIELEQAVRIVIGACERGNLMPRSGILDLGSLALDPAAGLDHRTRIEAAKAVSQFAELEIVKTAVHVIGSDETPLDVLQAAAVILLGASARRLSHKTIARLLRIARRHAIVRGPVVELLLLAVLRQRSPKAK